MSEDCTKNRGGGSVRPCLVGTQNKKRGGPATPKGPTGAGVVFFRPGGDLWSHLLGEVKRGIGLGCLKRSHPNQRYCKAWKWELTHYGIPLYRPEETHRQMQPRALEPGGHYHQGGLNHLENQGNYRSYESKGQEILGAY